MSPQDETNIAAAQKYAYCLRRITARMIARSVISQVSTNVPGKPKQAKYSFMGYSPPMSDF